MRNRGAQASLRRQSWLRAGRAGLALVLGLAVVLVSGGGLWYVLTRDTSDPGALLREAVQKRSLADYAAAEELAISAWKLDSSRTDAVMLAVDCALAQQAPQRALEWLELSLASSSAPQRNRLLMRKASIQNEYLRSLDGMEATLKEILTLAPDHLEANRELANLLGLCGRRSEAIPCILKLVQQGQSTDLLILISRDDGRIDDPRRLESVRELNPNDRNALLGLAVLAAAEDRPSEAFSRLAQIQQNHSNWIPMLTVRGRLLLAREEWSELSDWAAALPADADQSAEIWYIRGRIAERDSQSESAVRCLWESMLLAPESRATSAAYLRSLQRISHPAAAGAAEHMQRLQRLDEIQNQVLFSEQQKSLAPYLALVDANISCGRLWEARGWLQLLIENIGSDPELENRLRSLIESTAGLRLTLTFADHNIARADDFSSLPLPIVRAGASTDSTVATLPLTPIRFRDETASSGLKFRFINGTRESSSHRMFSFSGGGIGVIDFDADGDSDLFFNQGNLWPGAAVSDQLPAELFRNQSGKRWERVDQAAQLDERGFGQGVAVGDLDQDGFEDLFVATIGANQIWLNQGDGTFRRQPLPASLAGSEWTTSCAIADFNQDSIPDVYAVNYLTGADLFDRVCPDANNRPRMCMPFHFDPARDQLLLNDGTGSFVDATSERLEPQPDGKGLGIAVWDVEGDGRLEIFVANDTTANFLFVSDSFKGNTGRLVDRAALRGLAFNEAGKAEGCMGIALAPLGNDSSLSVFVTNFLAESNTLWRPVAGEMFEDRTRAANLQVASIEQLGFGTRFLDADRDGRVELFVANGHIDDLSDLGRPYRMRPQLFRFNGREFIESRAGEAGDYFQSSRLGRAVVSLDWNQDLHEDLVAGHLADPAVLLTNVTPDTNHAISLRCVATRSERTAIGTRITAASGDTIRFAQITAGDGYLASSTREVFLPMSKARVMTRLTIEWPSGLTEHYDHVAGDKSYVAIERRGLFVIP